MNNFQKQPPEVFYKKDVLRNFTKFTGKHLCQTLFFNKFAVLRPAKKKTEKETMTQVFSCEFCEISKNTFFNRTPTFFFFFFSILYFRSIVIVYNSYTVQNNILIKIDGGVYSYIVEMTNSYKCYTRNKLNLNY